jgi:mRNA degradation ribonuclease J1/J2
VSNVGTHGHADEAGGVEFLVHVDSNVPLNVMVTITVLEDIEQFVRA